MATQCGFLNVIPTENPIAQMLRSAATLTGARLSCATCCLQYVLFLLVSDTAWHATVPAGNAESLLQRRGQPLVAWQGFWIVCSNPSGGAGTLCATSSPSRRRCLTPGNHPFSKRLDKMYAQVCSCIKSVARRSGPSRRCCCQSLVTFCQVK